MDRQTLVTLVMGRAATDRMIVVDLRYCWPGLVIVSANVYEQVASWWWTMRGNVVTLSRVYPPAGIPLTHPTTTYTITDPDRAAGTETASTLGSRESGVTRYEMKNLYTSIFFGSPHHTTVTDATITAIATIEQGESIHREMQDPVVTMFDNSAVWLESGMSLDCVINGGQQQTVCSGAWLYPSLTELVEGGGNSVGDEEERSIVVGYEFTR
ncbi:hypothetical protein BJ165DRAFT_1411056 [Panaeolus papilionaceus]|nr:hypothetical protein BJ165DRAFT_1411056 [Panaeolus papilionaceus]